VLAVPGEITSALSAGTNALLRLGAIPVTCAGDVLESLGIEAGAALERAPFGAAAASLLERLREGALTGDELVRTSAIDPGAASAALIELELAGAIALEDGVYRASV
jgi:DNA processing protein